MRMIKPIVNISKIMDAYDVILCGFNGVIHDGVAFKPEAIEALLRLKKNGKKIVLVTNSSLRVSKIIEMMYSANISPKIFTAIVTAGEILHYKLMSQNSIYSALGKIYYNLGTDKSVFEGVDYTSIDNPSRVDFLYIGQISNPNAKVEDYIDILSHAVSLNIPMLCVGNDTSAFVDGKIALAPGAIAEQYAILGGKILTLGKPDPSIMRYALEACGEYENSRTLMIGDSISTDVKAASSVNILSVLISKGIHVNYLGEGYIPDVTKTRELATNYDSYPDYVASNLRW